MVENKPNQSESKQQEIVDRNPRSEILTRFGRGVTNLSIHLSYSLRDVYYRRPSPEILDTEIPYVVAVTHRSALDIPLAARALQLAGIKRVPRFVAKEELWEFGRFGNMRPFGALLDRVGTIPIESENPSKESILRLGRIAAETLADDLSLVIYPEGTRGRDLEKGTTAEMQKGAVVIAARINAPLLPITIEYIPTRNKLITGRSDAFVTIKPPFEPRQMETNERQPHLARLLRIN